MMKSLLTALFAIGIFVTACNAGCYRQKPTENTNGCLYQGTWHRLNSKWRTVNCMDCTCNAGGSVECCTSYGTPVKYDKENCKAVFNKKTCSYKVLQKNDHSKECEIFAMVL